MTKHYCDGCKAELKGFFHGYELSLSNNRTFIFCEDCWAKLIVALRRFMPEVGVAEK